MGYFRAGHQLLSAAGYQQYETSAYAKPGFQCQHNLNYWRFGDYLGIGCGAHGKITFPDGRILRTAKTATRAGIWKAVTLSVSMMWKKRINRLSSL
ncbi:radical SAM protein [Klebsiella pneumoniae]|uniref:Radical SAM protein n=1 Tax=Klebsiella pneumoniae TaxID=573 RepID=A0A2X3EWL0_KLEPN|nr:radical SAM protein [Klebsiella pneumoniae]